MVRRILTGLVGLAVVASGCGVTDADPETAESRDPVTTTVADTGRAANSDVLSDVTVGTNSRYSSGVLTLDCAQRVEPERGESSAQLPSPMLFDPSTGEFTTIDSPEIPAGTELVEAGCMPSGTSDDPSLTYRLVLRTPSQGLDPESYESRIVTYSTDADAPPVTATLDLPTDRQLRSSFMAGTGGNLLYTHNSDMSSAGEIVLIQPDGTVLNTHESTEDAPLSVTYVDDNSYVVSDGRNWKPDIEPVLYDARTGERADHVELRIGDEIVDLAADGFVIARESGSNGRYEHLFVNTREGRTYDAGERQQSGKNAQVWEDYLVASEDGLEVVDLDTGEVVLSRSTDEWDRLGVKNVYTAGQYLYVQNDDDSPVIDLTTGEQVSAGWEQRPTNVISQDWTLVMPHPITNNYAQCYMERTQRPMLLNGIYSLDDVFGCYEEGTLMHSPGGYDGPWF